jgi:hypothetical protein
MILQDLIDKVKTEGLEPAAVIIMTIGGAENGGKFEECDECELLSDREQRDLVAEATPGSLWERNVDCEVDSH